MGTRIVKKLDNWRRLIIVLGVVSLLVACGQKGDLYLPEGYAFTSWIG